MIVQFWILSMKQVIIFNVTISSIRITVVDNNNNDENNNNINDNDNKTDTKINGLNWLVLISIWFKVQKVGALSQQYHAWIFRNASLICLLHVRIKLCKDTVACFRVLFGLCSFICLHACIFVCLYFCLLLCCFCFLCWFWFAFCCYRLRCLSCIVFIYYIY